MEDEFDVDAMVNRFRERATAVRSRGMPPLEGADRRRFLDRMKLDFQDFAMLGDATGAIEDGFLVLRVDLRPPAPNAGEAQGPASGSEGRSGPGGGDR
ncbi:MAG: hypothetical protein ACR2LJ_13060 [Acidimicrobiales bacterium]